MATINAGDLYSTIGSAKELYLPAQPAFLGQNNGDIVNVTGDGSVYTCEFTEIFDNGSNFALNIFTAPVTGKYLFLANIAVANTAAGHTDGVCSIVTTSNTYTSYLNPYVATGSASRITYICSALCQMSAGDTARVQLTISGGAKAITYCGAAEAYTTFSGTLIC